MSHGQITHNKLETEAYCQKSEPNGQNIGSDYQVDLKGPSLKFQDKEVNWLES